tara:strand:+ start:33 stop:623 length:591 start_codon:yes stop_codon:yes gene_type:complete
MGIVSRAADLYYTFRFLKTLVTKWEDMPAYKLGIIDDNGTVIWDKDKSKTSEEKDAYTVFHRLVFNIKRIMQKVPFGRSRLASYAAALFLLREHTNMSEKDIAKVLDEAGIDIDSFLPEETQWNIQEDQQLSPGIYVLQNDMPSHTTGEMIYKAGTKVSVAENTKPCGSVFGENIYTIRHVGTKTNLYVAASDIYR